MTVLAIDHTSDHFETVKKLWRANSVTLGFLPDGAFEDYARRKRILVAVDAGYCVGYLLYRAGKVKATIAHLCVDKEHRGNGHSRALVNHLMGITGHLRGIDLRCRRDFDANKLWPSLGFAAVTEKAGRAADGSELTRWWYDHGHPDLFTPQAEAEIEAVLDANVFLDLLDHSRDEESLGLLADWLQPSVRYFITSELANEFDRTSDPVMRRQRKLDTELFHTVIHSASAHQKAEQELAPLFPNRTCEQDESDFRHLVHTHAAGKLFFVTRDDGMLDMADRVYPACGLSIVRPAELIGRIDELAREPAYQRQHIAGQKQVSRRRIGSATDSLLKCIRVGGERLSELRSALNPFFAHPQKYGCHTYADSDGTTLAFYMIERGDGFDRVPILRVCAERVAGTLARTILMELANSAAEAKQSRLLVSEARLSNAVASACSDLGFAPAEGGQMKLIFSGLRPRAELAQAAASVGASQIATVLQSSMDAITASQVEHAFWPAKIADAEIPCFIVPIRAEFAQHLFDTGLSRQTLFGADVDLALNPESVYYRAVRPAVVTCPGRILWYVTKGDFDGTMSIRACSRIVEVTTGKPKALFKRFRRLGVYDWEQVFETAGRNVDQEIMAIRFDDTEQIRPIHWNTFQGILTAHGKANPLQGPVRIPTEVFNAIYSLAVNPPQVRGQDSGRGEARGASTTDATKDRSSADLLDNAGQSAVGVRTG